MWVTTLFVLMGICVVTYLAYRYLTDVRENFFVTNERVKFLTSKDVATFLKQDQDGYVSNMSPTDLYARRVHSPEVYRQKISEAAMDFTTDQMIRFSKAASEADQLLQGEKELAGICEVPWTFAMTRDDVYEEGLPHTRANIIFVSSSIDERHLPLVKTLIHEKIHLYQRMYPEKMAQLMEARGYQRWKQRLGIPRIRANPDLDPWVYFDSTKNEPMIALYTSDKPSNITDIVLTDAAFEHPYEKIAYEVSSRLVKDDYSM